MYYPILKSKQYELAALKELVGHIPVDKVCPILEPVNVSLAPWLILCLNWQLRASPRGS